MVEDSTTTNFSLKWVKSSMISFLVFKFFSGMIYVQGCRPWGFRGCHGILADQLTLFQTGGEGGGANYAHQIKSGTPRFSDPPKALM